LIFATLQAVAFFYFVPAFGFAYWENVLKWLSDNGVSYTQFLLCWSLFQHDLIHIVSNFVYYIYYRYEFPWIEKYKTNYEESWPWHSDPDGWRKMVKWSILVAFLNSNIIPVLVFIPLNMNGLIKEHTMRVEYLPTPFQLAATIMFCMLCEDFAFYWSHRFLHWKAIYPHIHKIHHSYV